MLTIEVELLAGRYAATKHNDRSQAEWPPHPARLFSALVAALHDQDPADLSEREALLWLERQGAPSLDVDLSVSEDVGRRDVRAVFVPVNDVSLVGDADRELRKSLDDLRGLEQLDPSKETMAEVKKAQKAVEAERRKLQKLLAEQMKAPEKSSKEELKRASGLLPERRNRQERTFPVIVPERTTFAFQWVEADPCEHLGALRSLLQRVTRLGHSSSLVRCAIAERPVEPTLVPSEGGEHVLRIVGPGQLERLESAYERHQAVESRVLPARPQRYGEPVGQEPLLPRSVFDDQWIVFERVGGHRPLSSRGSDLAMALRRALIEIHGREDLPTALSGHSSKGELSKEPHAAFLPLPWVGHQHADGSVQGLAIVLPRQIELTSRGQLLRLIARWEAERGDATDDFAIELGTQPESGRPLSLRLKRVEIPTKATLNAARWCKPSRKFVTATPIALDRHPGNLRSNTERTAHRAAADAESSIADACERIGLPRPTSVTISMTPLLPGSEHIRHFAPWPAQPGRTRRARVHAEIEFSERVCGPLLIGAGRFFGLGLCLPIRPDGGN